MDAETAEADDAPPTRNSETNTRTDLAFCFVDDQSLPTATDAVDLYWFWKGMRFLERGFPGSGSNAIGMRSPPIANPVGTCHFQQSSTDATVGVRQQLPQAVNVIDLIHFSFSRKVAEVDTEE